MKTSYLLLMVGLLLVGCNNQTNVEKPAKSLAKKSKLKKNSAESVFTNQQISNLEFQVEAFKIGSEKMVNAELKKYLTEHLPELKDLLSEYKSAAIANNFEVNAISNENQENLYKLAIADVKGFDNIFALYYKDFLNKTIDEIASHEIENESLNALKNKYGNILYAHKLYFDVLK